MNDVWEIVQQGGPVMFALLVVSLLMYEACFRLLFFLTRVRWRVAQAADGLRSQSVAQLRALQSRLRERYTHDRIVIGAWVAAAPLLGLLGTVMGMVNTFDSMASRHGQNTAGLAEGISMALITTETGLAIAIPAVVLMYYAHRQLQRAVHRLVQLEDAAVDAA